MSNKNSRFVANQKKKATFEPQPEPQQLPKTTKLVDTSTREGRIAKTPYSQGIN